jgi:hypothetical protein
MKITLKEKHLLDLLEETLPFLRFCMGGTHVDATYARVQFALEMAGRLKDED